MHNNRIQNELIASNMMLCLLAICLAYERLGDSYWTYLGENQIELYLRLYGGRWTKVALSNEAINLLDGIAYREEGYQDVPIFENIEKSIDEKRRLLGVFSREDC